jgi:hypothetical protein
MTTMHLGTLSPSEDDNKIIDLKQAAFQVTPVDTVTPSLTPTSPSEGDVMAGKKLYSLEKPDDKAKELASKLTLEEQVCTADERTILTVRRLCGICHIYGFLWYSGISSLYTKRFSSLADFNVVHANFSIALHDGPRPASAQTTL